jgi:flagellar protein FliO/FliZ
MLFSTAIFAQESASDDEESLLLPQASSSFEESLLLLDAEETTSGSRASGFAMGSLIQSILALLLVLALIYGTVYLLRKFSGKESQMSTHITVLERHSISTGASIALVEVAERLFILGVGDNVTPIAEVTDKEFIDALKLAEARKAPVAGARFSAMLQERFTKKTSHSPSTDDPEIKSDFIKDYASRLNQKPPVGDDNE